MGNRILNTIFRVFFQEILLGGISIRDRLNDSIIAIIIDRYISHALLVFPKFIHCRIVSDPIYPARETPLFIVLIDMPIYSEKHLLQDIFGILVGIPRNTHDIADELSFICIDDFPESIGISVDLLYERAYIHK